MRNKLKMRKPKQSEFWIGLVILLLGLGHIVIGLLWGIKYNEWYWLAIGLIVSIIFVVFGVIILRGYFRIKQGKEVGDFGKSLMDNLLKILEASHFG